MTRSARAGAGIATVSADVLGRAGVLVVVALAPAFAAALAVGLGGFALVFLGTLLAVGAVLTLGRRAALPFVATVVVLAACAAVVRESAPVILGLLVAAAAIATGAASRVSSRITATAPIVVLMAAMIPTPMTPPIEAAWIAVGAVWALVVAAAADMHAPPDPVPLQASGIYTVVLATSCGLAAALTLMLDLPRGYWLVIALSMLVKPSTGAAMGATRMRVAGTLAGGAVALALALVLPPAATAVLAIGAATLAFAYMLTGRVLAQIASLTVMIVLLTGTAGGVAVAEADALRLGWTLAGAAIAIGLAFAVEHLTPRTAGAAGR